MKQQDLRSGVDDDVRAIASLLPTLVIDLRFAALLHPQERELGAAQLIALIALDEASEAGLPVGQLAERVGIAIPAASGVADRLEKGGYVERVRDLRDRRVVLLRPTDKGREATRRLRTALEDTVATALEGLDPGAREQIVVALHEVAAFSTRLHR